MSALDRAFVKVYRQGGAPLAPPGVDLTAQIPLAESVEGDASPRDGGISVAELYSTQITFADIGHASVRRPHTNFSLTAAHQVEIALPPLAQEPNAAEPTPAVRTAPSLATPASTSPTPSGPAFAAFGRAASGPTVSAPSPHAAAFRSTSPVSPAFASASAVKAPPALSTSTSAALQSPEAAKTVEAEPAAARARQPLRPVFEVPRFSWPSIVKTLSAAAEAQIAVLTRAMTAASRQGQKLVLITGCARGEGRTTLSLALGKALASPARKVLLVDADFEHSQLADALGVLPQVGWDDVLWGNQPLAEALIESLDDHLSLLPLRQPAAGPQRRTPAAQWKASLSELTQNYDIVLLDAGPLTDDRKACDTAALAAQHPIDSALVVCDLRRASADVARDVGRRLVACDITRWNIVENFCPVAA